MTVTLNLAASGNHGPASETVTFNVILPERTLSWKPIASSVYGVPITLDALGVDAGEGDPVRVEFPLGPLVVGQAGPNLRIVAPGKPGASLDAVRDATVVVTPAPRTVQFTPLKAGTLLAVGTTITVSNPFKARPSVGTDPVVVLAPVGGLIRTAGPLEVVLGFAANPNFVDTPKTINVTVEKGLPVINWSNPPALVVDTPLPATALNATCPSVPGAAISYSMVLNDRWVSCAGQTVPKAGQYFLKAKFAGNTDWLPAEKEVRILVMDSARASAGAQAMSSSAAISACWNKPTDVESTAVFTAWDNDEGKMKTQGKEIMAKVQTMNEEQLRTYCKSLKGAKQSPASPKADENVSWLLPNKLQLRLKPEGDRHTRSVMFSIEAVKGAGFSNDLSGVAFKLASCGEPAPKTPGQARMPHGNAAAQADFQAGVAAATHIKCQPMQPNEITWALLNGANVPRREPVPVATALGGANVEFWLKTQKLEDWKILAATARDVEVSARTTATEQFKATIEKRIINIV